ncbi:NAD(P)H-dependent glycerol-3-phosphate dehydrogenase [Alicyclobacillus tolerans]|uniref:NAD(P)H-dependent glycerol-3-phosphate dehydrogenase n=1 Tax=Alicyclobacillus tolerans TaxID=90970 RepID=UPI003B8210A1
MLDDQLPNRIAVIGAGSWGTAIAHTLAKKNMEVTLWARNESIVNEINQSKCNSKYLPNCLLHPNIHATTSLQETVDGSPYVFLVVPSVAVPQIVASLQSFAYSPMTIVHAIKGFIQPHEDRVSLYLQKKLAVNEQQIAVIGGPSHAEEVVRSMPTTLVVSSPSKNTAHKLQDMLMSNYLRVYTNPDWIGIEIAGALKNIIALSVGMAVGLGFGDNAKAAIMTRGLAEIARLGIAMGASPLTFSGLAGVGDLIATCISEHSRNFRTGRLLGQGMTLKQAVEAQGMVVEGVRATEACLRLASQYHIEMPITEAVAAVLFEGKQPKQVVSLLMDRDKTTEMEEWVLSSENTSWRFV